MTSRRDNESKDNYNQGDTSSIHTRFFSIGQQIEQELGILGTITAIALSNGEKPRFKSITKRVNKESKALTK